jgi:hypothetical protein
MFAGNQGLTPTGALFDGVQEIFVATLNRSTDWETLPLDDHDHPGAMHARFDVVRCQLSETHSA